MKIFFVYILLLFCNPGFAEVHIENSNQLAPPAHFSRHLIIKHGKLEEDADGFLFNPVCTGVLQSPALVTDLRSFLENYAGTRVIYRSNDHYLLLQKAELAEGDYLSQTDIAKHAGYGGPGFSLTTAGTLVPAAPIFFPEKGMSTSSCRAGATYQLHQVRPHILEPHKVETF